VEVVACEVESPLGARMPKFDEAPVKGTQMIVTVTWK
jgi:hypothetical protein